MSITGEAFGQPALLFEEAHGLKGVAARYQFPKAEGLDRLSLQHRIWPAYGMQELPEKDIPSIFSRLEALNPSEVSRMQLNRASSEQVRDVVYGMVSGFNPDDINLFLRRAYGDKPLMQVINSAEEKLRVAAQTEIMQRLSLGTSFGWVASEPTLEHIWQQVKDRPIINTFERAAETLKNNYTSKSNLALLAGVGVGLGVAAYMLLQRREKPRENYREAYESEKKAASESPVLKA